MKRCILVDNRTSKDKKTGDDLMFLTLAKLPNAMKDGGLWHPKQADLIVNVCINKTLKAEDYEKFMQVRPGALFDITFGVNDFNGSTYVATCTLVPNTNVHKAEILYIK